jgi:hypothetical protein
MSNKQVKFSELTENQKKQLARDVAKIWVNRWKEEHRKAISDIFTPFWVKWWIKLKKTYGGNK